MAITDIFKFNNEQLNNKLNVIEEKIDQVLQMMQNLQDTQKRLQDLQNTVDILNKKVDELKRAPKQPINTQNFQQAHLGIAIDMTDGGAGAQFNQPASPSAQPSKTPPPPPPAKRKFYAIFSQRKGVLTELPDSSKNQCPFVAEVKGDSGVVRFNKECEPYAIKALSDTIYPFFEYELKSNSPTSITPQNEAQITHLSGNEWKMDGKIKVIIS